MASIDLNKTEISSIYLGLKTTRDSLKANLETIDASSNRLFTSVNSLLVGLSSLIYIPGVNPDDPPLRDFRTPAREYKTASSSLNSKAKELKSLVGELDAILSAIDKMIDSINDFEYQSMSLNPETAANYGKTSGSNMINRYSSETAYSRRDIENLSDFNNLSTGRGIAAAAVNAILNRMDKQIDNDALSSALDERYFVSRFGPSMNGDYGYYDEYGFYHDGLEESEIYNLTNSSKSSSGFKNLALKAMYNIAENGDYVDKVIDAVVLPMVSYTVTGPLGTGVGIGTELRDENAAEFQKFLDKYPDYKEICIDEVEFDWQRAIVGVLTGGNLFVEGFKPNIRYGENKEPSEYDYLVGNDKVETISESSADKDKDKSLGTGTIVDTGLKTGKTTADSLISQTQTQQQPAQQTQTQQQNQQTAAQQTAQQTPQQPVQQPPEQQPPAQQSQPAPQPPAQQSQPAPQPPAAPAAPSNGGGNSGGNGGAKAEPVTQHEEVAVARDTSDVKPTGDVPSKPTGDTSVPAQTAVPNPQAVVDKSSKPNVATTTAEEVIPANMDNKVASVGLAATVVGAGTAMSNAKPNVMGTLPDVSSIDMPALAGSSPNVSVAGSNGMVPTATTQSTISGGMESVYGSSSSSMGPSMGSNTSSATGTVDGGMKINEGNVYNNNTFADSLEKSTKDATSKSNSHSTNINSSSDTVAKENEKVDDKKYGKSKSSSYGTSSDDDEEKKLSKKKQDINDEAEKQDENKEENANENLVGDENGMVGGAQGYLTPADETVRVVATGVTVGGVILSAVLKLLSVLNWLAFILLIIAIILLYSTYRYTHHKIIEKRKREYLIRIEKVNKVKESENLITSEGEVTESVVDNSAVTVSEVDDSTSIVADTNENSNEEEESRQDLIIPPMKDNPNYEEFGTGLDFMSSEDNENK